MMSYVCHWPGALEAFTCGGKLSIHRRGLSVGVGFVLIRIQHLDFVEAHHEYAAIAASLIGTHRRHRLRELHMQLAVSERPARMNEAAVRATA